MLVKGKPVVACNVVSKNINAPFQELLSSSRPSCRSPMLRHTVIVHRPSRLVLSDNFEASPSNITLLSPRDGLATSLDFSASQWIWTGEEAGPGGTAPDSTRAFRTTVISPNGTCAVCATIIITAYGSSFHSDTESLNHVAATMSILSMSTANNRAMVLTGNLLKRIQSLCNLTSISSPCLLPT